MGPETRRATPEEQERAVLEMVRRYLTEARERRATGKLTFELEISDGGVRQRKVAPCYIDK